MCYYDTGEVELCAEETPEYDDICPGAPGDEPPAMRRGSAIASKIAGGARRRSSVLTGGQGGGAPSHRVTLRRGDCFGTAVLEAIFKGGDRATSIDIPASPEGRGSYALIDGSVGGRGKYRCTGKSLGTVVVLELRRGNLRSAKATEENQIPLSILESVNESASKSLKDFLNLASVQRLRLLCGMPARTIKEGHALEPEVLFESSGAEDKPAAGMEVSEKVSHHTKVVQVVIKGMVTAETAVEGEGEAEESKPLEWGDCVDEEALARPCKKSLKSPKGDSAIVELDADMLIAMSGLMSTVARRSDAGVGEKATVDSLEELKQVAILGAGGYGFVCLVEQESTERVFALKKMSKPHVVSKRQVDHVNNERKLLSMCDHPFVIELFGSFQDKDYLYLLLELVLGGELFTYLDVQGPIKEGPARFFGASVAMALEYLHQYRIAYRDLKPENILIDAQGYIKVVDFGFAKVVYEGERTWTLCGTPEYLAPEVILRKGHDVRVDWWSLGILIVELFTGGTPFYSDDHFDVFKKIVKGEIPEGNWKRMSPEAADCVKALLVKEPEKRLGAVEKGGPRMIRETKFFQPLDFVKLVNKQVTPPWKPIVSHATDTRYSPDEDEIELPEPTAAAMKAAEEHENLYDFFPEFQIMDEPGGEEMEEYGGGE